MGSLLVEPRTDTRAGSIDPPGFAPSAWISAAEFAALRRHPELPNAVAEFAVSMIDAYEGNALLNMLLCDRGRVLVGLFLLYLDVLPHPTTGERGATLGAVQSLCRQTGICSPGRTASLLAAMRFGGYLAPRPDPADARRRILVPSAKLTTAHERNWARQFHAMTPVFPGADLVPGCLQDSAYRTGFLRQLGTDFLAGFRVLDHVPVLRRLAESNAGLLLLSRLAAGHMGGEQPQEAPVPVSISALARRFRVSRAHVRNMLAVSVDAGLLAHATGAETVTIRPALVEALIQFYGVLFILFNRCAAGARNETANAADRCTQFVPLETAPPPWSR